jgi:YaiO family outer membrane protein
MREASELQRSGKQETAEKIYNEVLSNNPDDVDALVGRGFCRLKDKSRYEEALADFKRVIQLAPDYVDAYFGQAIIYRRRGDRASARDVLLQCKRACEGDEEKLRYLAVLCWREGHFSLARQLDREYPPPPHRRLIKHPNEVCLNYSPDWVKNRPDWETMGFSFVRQQRRDFTWWFSFTRYYRYQKDDLEVGLGIAFRYTHSFGIEYEGYFSDSAGFLADQKHLLKSNITLPSSTIVGLGLNLSKYNKDWARLGRLELTQYIGACHAKYTLLSGMDNNDESVTTHIFELSYERELRYSFRLGYATGNESIDRGGGSFFSDLRVDTLFTSVRYYLTSTWGLIIGGAREWRDERFNRDMVSVSIFKRF